ncbi:hypothetical protein GLOIN_2v1762755 [Rhizophagus clarus]|uniref:Mid2 domain-containing protein n=1 Tax=Rhizophagus clarus TaxID=94130 RepID=A0A8H3LAE0_9GLOM|nr:hypothetical protein GLOIN_2v1762755 [Rhizophagus clarus]
MKKFFILIFIILLQLIHEVNTQLAEILPATKTATTTEQKTNNMMPVIIIGIVGGSILIFLVGLCYLLVRMCKSKPTIGLNNKNIISNPGVTRTRIYTKFAIRHV